jgi:hypothetical protein
VAKIVRVTISAVLIIILATTLVSAPLAEAGVTADLTISKVGPPGKVQMSDSSGPVKKKTLNNGDVVQICNELTNGQPVTLTVRDKNGNIVHQVVIQPHECVFLTVGSAQLPSGTNYKVSGGSFINLDGIPGVLNEAVFEFASVIGGEMSSLDSAALLVAGFQTNVSWMIPVALAGIGISVFLAKRK